MDTDSNSDCESIIDADTAYLECDIENDGAIDPKLIDSKDSDDDDSEEEVDEEAYLSKCGTINWLEDPSHFRGRFERGSTDEAGTFNVDLRTIRTPQDAFEVFMDRSVLETVINYTNAEGAHNPDFQPVTLRKMLAFIAIFIGGGKNHDSKLHIRELWSTDEVMARIFYGAIMSRNRYLYS